MQPKLAHPVRFVLDVGDLVDDFGIDALAGLKDRGGFGAKVVLVDLADLDRSLRQVETT